MKQAIIFFFILEGFNYAMFATIDYKINPLAWEQENLIAFSILSVLPVIFAVLVIRFDEQKQTKNPTK